MKWAKARVDFAGGRRDSYQDASEIEHGCVVRWNPKCWNGIIFEYGSENFRTLKAAKQWVQRVHRAMQRMRKRQRSETATEGPKR